MLPNRAAGEAGQLSGRVAPVIVMVIVPPDMTAGQAQMRIGRLVSPDRLALTRAEYSTPRSTLD